MNNYSGSGRVCLPPQRGKTATNTDYIRFIVEIERPKGNDGKQKFDKIRVGCWGPICKYAQYIEEDDVVEFTGPITTGSYQSEGKWVNTWEISAKTLKIVKKNIQAAEPIRKAPEPDPIPPPPPPAPPADDTGLLPFDLGGYYG